jgi:hypothetical protein
VSKTTLKRRYTLSRNDVRTDRRCSKYDRRQSTSDPRRLRTAEGIEALFFTVVGLAHMTRIASSKAARRLHASYEWRVSK